MYGIDGTVQQTADAYRQNPQALQERYAMSQQLVDLLALQKIKSDKEAAQRDMQLAMQQEPGTVAQQREREVMDMTRNEVAQQVGGVAQQQAAQQQKAMQQMLAQGTGQGGGIANIPQRQVNQPRAFAEGGIVALQEGGRPADRMLEEALRQEGVSDPELRRFISTLYQQESSGGRNTRSPQGAMGGLQIMPGTFDEVAPDLNNRDDVDLLRGGIRYAKQAWNASDGNPRLAAAYYHGGPGGMRRVASGDRGAADDLGKRTGDYAEDIASRMGTADASRLEGRTTTSAPERRPTTVDGDIPQVPEHLREPQSIGNEPPAYQRMQEMQRREQNRPPRREGIAGIWDAAKDIGGGIVDTLSGEAPPAVRETAQNLKEDWQERTPNAQALLSGEGGIRELGGAVRESVTAPYSMVRDSVADVGGQFMEGLTGGPGSGAPAQPAPPSVPGQNNNMPPDPQTMIAQALQDKLGGGRPAPAGGQQPPTNQYRQANDAMLAERRNPRGRKMDRLAAWLGSGGGGGTPGQIGARQVATGQALQEQQRGGIEALVNKELDRQNQAGIYRMREGAANQRNIQDIMARLQIANTEQNNKLVQQAYEELTSIGSPSNAALEEQIAQRTEGMDPDRAAAIRNALVAQAVEERVRDQMSVMGSLQGGGDNQVVSVQIQ